MLTKTKPGFYVPTLLRRLPNLTSFYTSRSLGDVRQPKVREKVLALAEIYPEQVVWAKQIHGNKIATVSTKDLGKELTEVDGLIWRKESNQTLYLFVHVADCVPLLMVDPGLQIIAAVHAGWQSTLGNIAARAVKAMSLLGAQPKNLYVSIGPAIGSCCYDVPEERIKKFQGVFSDNHSIIRKQADKWYLDLPQANKQALLRVGVLAKHIDQSNRCTATNFGEFFSYRRDTSASFGEIMGLIGYKN